MIDAVNYNDLNPSERRAKRNEYIAHQSGLCRHCNNPLDVLPPNDILKLKVNEKLFPLNFFNWPVHLHHSHDTGLTIGAVHCYCNAVLWQYHGE